ncbi:MAG TPA: hypothetical protein VFL98_00445 [Candidatus Paceibacterota bacterium]|nr:hypothetical protein [Candidatus Paceibacterota bacterium]
MPLSTGKALLLAAGLALLSFPAAATPRLIAPLPSADTPDRGINVVLYSEDYQKDLDLLDWKDYKLFDRLLADHINAISLEWPLYMDTLTSSSVHVSEKTPSDDALRRFLAKAYDYGFAVVLHPTIDEHAFMDRGGDWRGTMHPRDVAAWFASYAALLVHYADLGEEMHARSLIIGTEFVSMEKYTSRWRALIAEVRKHFSGTLTYAANSGIAPDIPWDALDYVSVDAFFRLETPTALDPSVDELIDAWQKWIPQVESRAKAIGKPLVFSEIGTTSQRYAHDKNWLWSHGTAVDLLEQSRFYEAACRVWSHRLAGMYWWMANVWLPADPSKDGGYGPLGKPAEDVMRSCFADGE